MDQICYALWISLVEKINSTWGTGLDLTYSLITLWEITFFTRTNTQGVKSSPHLLLPQQQPVKIPLALICFHRQTNESLVKGEEKGEGGKKTNKRNTARGARLAAYQHRATSKQHTRPEQDYWRKQIVKQLLKHGHTSEAAAQLEKTVVATQQVIQD